MMKKMFFMAGAALMLASCSNTEDVINGEKRAISFAAVNQRQSRATTDFAGSDLYVASIYKGSATTATSDFFFKNVKFSKGAETPTEWTSATSWYFPFSGTMKFFAIGADLTTALTDADFTYGAISNDTFGTVAVDFKQALDGSKDITFSNTTADVACPSSTAIPLVMKHSQAMIEVNIAAAEENTGANIKITGVQVYNPKLTGKLTVTPGATSTAAWDDAAVASSTPVSLNGFTAAALSATANQATKFGSLYVLPQDATKILISYELTNGSKKVTDTYTLDLNAGKTGEAILKWAMAKKYIYNFTISMKEVKFTATQEDWTAEESTPNIP